MPFTTTKTMLVTSLKTDTIYMNRMAITTIEHTRLRSMSLSSITDFFFSSLTSSLSSTIFSFFSSVSRVSFVSTNLWRLYTLEYLHVGDSLDTLEMDIREAFESLESFLLG